MGVISAMIEMVLEEVLGERNFDSLKSSLNCDMKEKGIVAV